MELNLDHILFFYIRTYIYKIKVQGTSATLQKSRKPDAELRGCILIEPICSVSGLHNTHRRRNSTVKLGHIGVARYVLNSQLVHDRFGRRIEN